MHDNCPGNWYLCIIDFKNSHIQILDSLRFRSLDEFRFKSVKIMVCFQTMFYIYIYIYIYISLAQLLTLSK